MTVPKTMMMLVVWVFGASLVWHCAETPAQSHQLIELEVTTTADAGPGSLRWALEQARKKDGPYRIHFGEREGPFSTPQIIQLESQLPEITGDITIDGFIPRHLWTAYGATISAGGKHRVFEVTPGATLHLIGITITDGYAPFGGAILNRGLLIVEGLTILGNRAEEAGGGIANTGGGVFVINSTIADGSAIRGGAIANLEGKVTVTHATLYRNSAETGMSIYSADALALANSILWGPEGAEGGQCFNSGNLVHSTHNVFVGDSTGCGTPLLESDPKIGNFGYYNGPTPVFVIEGDSPVINLAHADLSVDHKGNRLRWDQRGNGDPRFAGGYADIGAFERQSHLPSEYVVDTIENTNLRGCTATGSGNCPLRSAVELALAGRRPAPIRFDPRVFHEPQTLKLETLPENLDRRPLEFDGEGAAPITIHVPGPERDWTVKNGIILQFDGKDRHLAGRSEP